MFERGLTNIWPKLIEFPEKNLDCSGMNQEFQRIGYDCNFVNNFSREETFLIIIALIILVIMVAKAKEKVFKILGVRIGRFFSLIVLVLAIQGTT